MRPTGQHGDTAAGAAKARNARRFIAGALALGLALAGCARTNVQDVRVDAKGLPRPELIIVHDFAVSLSDVVTDRSLLSRLEQMATETPAAAQQQKVGEAVADTLSAKLVEHISKLGIPVQLASAAVPITGPTLSIEGQILSVDEGNRTRRMVIGLGAGASEVRALVQVFETTKDGRRLAEDFYAAVKSSRKPGFGPMAPAGAAAGHAASSAAVAGGVGLATERSQTAEGDAANMAREIMKVLAQYFADQGWISPEQASRARMPF